MSNNNSEGTVTKDGFRKTITSVYQEFLQIDDVTESSIINAYIGDVIKMYVDRFGKDDFVSDFEVEFTKKRREPVNTKYNEFFVLNGDVSKHQAITAFSGIEKSVEMYESMYGRDDFSKEIIRVSDRRLVDGWGVSFYTPLYRYHTTLPTLATLDIQSPWFESDGLVGRGILFSDNSPEDK